MFIFSIGRRTALVAIAAMLAGAAVAQTTPPRLRGMITKVSGDLVDVKTRNGSAQTLKLAPDATFFSASHAAISDIKADSFIGSAAVTQADGTLKALEVTVFPPGIKPGEGHYPWDLGEKSTMTNGTVGDLVVSNGRTITVRYADGEKKIVVPMDAPVVRVEVGDRSLLVPGAHFLFFLKQDANGGQVIGNGVIGKGDVVPPM